MVLDFECGILSPANALEETQGNNVITQPAVLPGYQNKFSRLVNNAERSLTIGLCPRLKAVTTANSTGTRFANKRYQSETASEIGRRAWVS